MIEAESHQGLRYWHRAAGALLCGIGIFHHHRQLLKPGNYLDGVSGEIESVQVDHGGNRASQRLMKGTPMESEWRGHHSPFMIGFRTDRTAYCGSGPVDITETP